MKSRTYKSFCYALKMDRENDILVVDPHAICIKDLLDIGVKNIVRARRPIWGQGISIRLCKESIFSKLWRLMKGHKK